MARQIAISKNANHLLYTIFNNSTVSSIVNTFCNETQSKHISRQGIYTISNVKLREDLI